MSRCALQGGTHHRQLHSLSSLPTLQPPNSLNQQKKPYGVFDSVASTKGIRTPYRGLASARESNH